MKRVILCPNPYRDKGLAAAKAAESILRSAGLSTVYCLPFKPEETGSSTYPAVRSSRSCGAATLWFPSAVMGPSCIWPARPPCGESRCWG